MNNDFIRSVPRGLDAIKYDRFIQKLDRPFLKGTSKENGDEALKNIITAPLAGQVSVGYPPNWTPVFHGAENSKQLWFHSLPFVGDLLTAYYETHAELYLDKLFDLLDSYLNWLLENRNGAAWSDEHAVSNRSRMLVYVIFASQRNDFNIPSPMRSLINMALYEHGAWLADDSHYVYNNHGVMADRALIEITLSPTDIPDRIVSKWQLHAINRLNMMLDHTFDEQGCCIENSPAYHVFNTSLFESVARFLGDNNIDVDHSNFSETINKAKAVSHLFFRKDGTFPLVGDTELHPTHWVDLKTLSAETGKGCFPNSGFFIYKGENLYLTAKCGGSSFSHRHVDETSITVNWGGQDFIIDSGYFNYDTKNDRSARDVRSYLGHSGIFTDRCSSVLFAKFAGPKALGALKEVGHGEHLWNIDMISHLDEKAKINRLVCCADENEIQIHDKISSTENTTIRQQFIIHPLCTIEVKGNNVRIVRENKVMELIIISDNDFKIVVENCSISEKFMQLQKAKRVVVISNSKIVSIDTKITMSND